MSLELLTFRGSGIIQLNTFRENKAKTNSIHCIQLGSLWFTDSALIIPDFECVHLDLTY